MTFTNAGKDPEKQRPFLMREAVLREMSRSGSDLVSGCLVLEMVKKNRSGSFFH